MKGLKTWKPWSHTVTRPVPADERATGLQSIHIGFPASLVNCVIHDTGVGSWEMAICHDWARSKRWQKGPPCGKEPVDSLQCPGPMFWRRGQGEFGESCPCSASLTRWYGGVCESTAYPPSMFRVRSECGLLLLSFFLESNTPGHWSHPHSGKPKTSWDVLGGILEATLNLQNPMGH